MKIRIVRCSSPHYWYNNHIGLELEVINDEVTELGYLVIKGRVLNSYVALEDAEEIEEPVRMVSYSDDSVISTAYSLYALQASRKLDQDIMGSNPRLCMEGRDLNLPDEDGWWLY